MTPPIPVGVAIFPTHEGIDLVELGQLAEERGFESLFVPEHTHIPASGRSQLASAQGDLPPEYPRTLDPFVTLSAVAACTSRIRLGTGICLLVQRDPIITAKAIATLDQLSDGRFVFGVGAGWNREEMLNHGTDPGTRFTLLRERIEAMKEIWSHDEASYAGEHVAFERIMSWPKPRQQPHPPVLVGGEGPRSIEIALTAADGWIPSARPGLLKQIAEVRARARPGFRLTVYGADPVDVPRFAEAGAERCVFWLPAMDRGAAIDRLMAIARELGL
jgi:probable F420-dependent oxidoreductase